MITIFTIDDEIARISRMDPFGREDDEGELVRSFLELVGEFNLMNGSAEYWPDFGYRAMKILALLYDDLWIKE